MDCGTTERFNKKSVLIPKSCKLLWQRWEEDMREQKKPKESWRFYLDLVYPKYHHSSPAPSLPPFRTLWITKTYSSHNYLEKTCVSILAVPPELRIQKTPKNLAISWVSFVGPFVLLPYLTQTPVKKYSLITRPGHLKKHHNFTYTRCPSQSQNQVSTASQASMDWLNLSTYS